MNGSRICRGQQRTSLSEGTKELRRKTGNKKDFGKMMKKKQKMDPRVARGEPRRQRRSGGLERESEGWCYELKEEVVGREGGRKGGEEWRLVVKVEDQGDLVLQQQVGLTARRL